MTKEKDRAMYVLSRKTKPANRFGQLDLEESRKKHLELIKDIATAYEIKMSSKDKAEIISRLFTEKNELEVHIKNLLNYYDN